MAHRPTLRDVADRAGVSTYTVSQALAGRPGVADATRQRVEQVAQDLGYVPNVVAASLKGQTSTAIGVMTASGRNQYYSMLVQAVDAVLQSHGLHAVTNDAMRRGRYERSLERQSVNELIQQRVAAIVATYSLCEESIAVIERWGVPLVFVDALPPDSSSDYPFVGCDNYSASVLVADYLGGLGITQVAMVAYPADWNTRAPRERGLRDRARALGVSVDTIESENSAEAAFEAVGAYLDGREPDRRPEALYAANTPLLQGTMRALRSRGLSVPADISVVGFDEFDWSELIDPPMTVVDQHIDEIGRTAGELVVRILADTNGREYQKDPASRIAISPTLVVRESCRRAAV